MKFVPERLKDMRIMKGYTAEKLAEQLEISKQAVSKYENGKAIPSTDVLTKLLQLFFIPQGYLTKPNMLPEEQSTIFYRRCRRTPLKELDVAQVYLKWCYEIILAGQEYFSLKQMDIPEWTDGMTVENMAEEVRRNWNLGVDPIRDLPSLLEAHGFFIFTLRLPNEKIDGYSQLIGNIPIIIINLNKGNRMRQQFSMAHELGHIVLHSRMKDSEEKNFEEMEKEADQFAGCFLMPEKEIKAELIRMDIDYIDSMGKKWGVSPHAIVERCRKISAFADSSDENAAHATSLFTKLNQRKFSEMEEEQELCSIRKALLDIGSSDELGREFLQNLRLPVEDVKRFCSLPDDAFNFAEPMMQENFDDVENVQLSFKF